MYDDENIGFSGSVFMGIITLVLIVAAVFYLKPNKSNDTNESVYSNNKSTEWAKVCEEQVVTSKFIKGNGGTSFNRNLSVVNNDYYLQMEDGSIWIVREEKDWVKVIVGKKDNSICNMEVEISNEFN